MKTFPSSAQHTHKEYCVFTLLSSKTGHKREGISIFWHNVQILPFLYFPYTSVCTTCRILSNDIVTVNGHLSMCRKTDVIARRAKPDVAIPCKFPECIVLWSCADLWRGLPRQCAHWLAMTYVIRYISINYDLPHKQKQPRHWRGC